MIKKALIVFALVFTLFSVNTAQARTLEEVGLTEEDVQYLTPAELDKILNAPMDTASSTILAEPSMVPVGTVNCFDYYSFGSIEVEFAPNVTSVVGGTSMHIAGTVKNNNPYPIVNGTIVLKIFKERNTATKDINGPDVVGTLSVNNVSIPANGSVPFKTTWQVPSYIRTGQYSVTSFFTVANKFNLLGLSFTDDIVGNSSAFTVIGKEGGVYFDKGTVRINNGAYYFASYAPKLPADVAAEFEAEIVNTTDQDQIVPVRWKLYYWDEQDPKNFVSEKEETVTVPANGKITVKYKTTQNKFPVYYVVAETALKDAKSILGMRFAREGVDALRLNFPSIMQYPLTKGATTTIFSCLHSVASPVVPNAKLKLAIKDENGKTILTYEYSGDVTGEMMGVKYESILNKTYKDFTVHATLYGNNTIVDEAVLKYSCKALDPDSCGTTKHGWMIVVGVIALILIIYIARNMRKKQIKTLLFMLTLTAIATFGSSAQAKDVVISSSPAGPFAEYRSASSWWIMLGNVTTQVRYYTQITKVNASGADTGEVVNDGATLPVGSKIKLQILPHGPRDISWNGTGFDMDTPYGAWSPNTSPVRSCHADDFLYSYWIEDFDEINDRYISLVVIPPTTQILDVPGLSCDGTEDSKSRICTVTQAVPISPQFHFDTTWGKMYHSYRAGDKYDDLIPGSGYTGPIVKPTNACSSNNIPLRTANGYPNRYNVIPTANTQLFTLGVPQRTINYSLSGITDPTNRPPSNPSITGPTEGYAGVSYNFSASSTDPDNDTVRYGVDWSGGTTVTQWIPATGFVADETPQTGSKIWTTPGVYSFKVKAQDSKGADSGWTTHTITILADRCTNISGGQSASLFQAYGRDYFFSLDDGKLYFTPSTAAAGSVCTVDMCSNTSAIESAIPVNQIWQPGATTPYEQYSCVSDAQTCSCSGRNKVCVQAGVTTNYGPDVSCNLTASCTYGTAVGNQIVFNFTAINVLGSMINGGSVPKTIPATGAGVITETRTISNSGDGQTSTATCSYSYDRSTAPEILNFTASKIVDAGRDCVFSWQTQDLVTCSLSGLNVAPTGVYPFSTALGRNITKTLTCISADTVPVTKSSTATCLVKPIVIEQ